MLGLDCTIYSRHAKHLNHFHLRCLCGLLYIRWQDKIPDLEFIERARIPSIHTLPKKPHVRWQCHVTRMPGSRLPKQLLYRAFGWWAEVLSWGTEKMFQRLPQRGPQRLGHQPQWLGVTCPGLSSLAQQSHHWGQCGQIPTGHWNTEETCHTQRQSNLHLHCRTHTLMSYVWVNLLGSVWSH